jgi:hypothetical protein
LVDAPIASKGDFDEQLTRKAVCEAGKAVVANIRSGFDAALWAWAEDAGRAVYIGRELRLRGLDASIWANPCRLPSHAGLRQRRAVIQAFIRYLDSRPDLRVRVRGAAAAPLAAGAIQTLATGTFSPPSQRHTAGANSALRRDSTTVLALRS